LKLPVSLVVPAKNEERALGRCLETLAGAVAEIIVCATGSTDGTRRVARRFGARFIEVRFRGDYSEIRNALLEAARQPWILSMDADQRIARSDVPRLGRLLRSAFDAYEFPRRNYRAAGFSPISERWRPCRGAYPLEEKWSGASGYADTPLLFLVRNVPGLRYRYPVHESLEPAVRELGLRRAAVALPVHHFEFAKGLGHHYRKHRAYKALLRKTLKRHPDHLFAYLALVSDLLLTENDLKEAAKTAAALTRKAPRSAVAWRARAVVALAAGRADRAAGWAARARAIGREPFDSTLQAWCLLRRGRLPQAAALLRASLAEDRHQPAAWNLLGVSLERQGRPAAALRAFGAALRLDPSFSEAAFNRSLVARQLR
jgi:tetratricopeptide (TPR) repeat protein